MSLIKHKQDWEDLGAVDPLWAVLTCPGRKFGSWDLDEFFGTGEQDIAQLMGTAAQLGYPLGRDAALDFGCGVGRLTRALAKRFGHCYGVDISENMIAKARELNQAAPNCTFLVNPHDHLRVFPDGHFDLIYTKYVLQHLPSQALIRSYIGEFVRILKEGGLLVLQVRTGLSLRVRLQLGRRLYGLLRKLGCSERLLHRRLGLSPIRMTAVSENEVTAWLNEAGAEVLRVEAYSVPSGQGKVYYASRTNAPRSILGR